MLLKRKKGTKTNKILFTEQIVIKMQKADYGTKSCLKRDQKNVLYRAIAKM